MSNYTPGPWYVANNANNSQGLIVSENAGENVAVSYDKKDAPLIAAAPELMDAVRVLLGVVQTYAIEVGEYPAGKDAVATARALLARIEKED